jgi:hypothetical protein
MHISSRNVVSEIIIPPLITANIESPARNAGLLER